MQDSSNHVGMGSFMDNLSTASLTIRHTMSVVTGEKERKRSAFEMSRTSGAGAPSLADRSSETFWSKKSERHRSKSERMSVCFAWSADRPDSPAHDDAVQVRSHDDVQRNLIQNRRSLTTGRGSNRRHASVSSKGKSDEIPNKRRNKRWTNHTEPENDYRYRLSNRC